MKRNERHPEPRATTRALVACATLALAMLLGAAPSSADPDRGRRGGPGHVYRQKAKPAHKHNRAHDTVVVRRDVIRVDNDMYRSHRRHRRNRDFVVPRTIRHRHVPRYETYRYGRVYHRRHRHYHAVYHFPVYTDRGVRYRAYTYCGDRMFAGGSIDVGGPRFHVHFDF